MKKKGRKRRRKKKKRRRKKGRKKRRQKKRRRRKRKGSFPCLAASVANGGSQAREWGLAEAKPQTPAWLPPSLFCPHPRDFPPPQRRRQPGRGKVPPPGGIWEAYVEGQAYTIWLQDSSFLSNQQLTTHSSPPIRVCHHSVAFYEGTDQSMGPKRAKLSLPGETDGAAAGIPIQALCEEALCPICLGYFRDPVMTECGHNFCKSCLAPWWEKSDQDASCPQCREKIQETKMRPNRKLASFVEIIKRFSLPEPKEDERKGKVCEKHQEPLKMFCEDDEIPICAVCDRSKEHRDHEVIPQEEAYQKYKDLLCIRLEDLKKERDGILANKAATEREGQNLLKQTRAGKEMTVAQFRQFHQFLEDQEYHLLAQIKEVEEEIARKREGYLAKLSRDLSCLESLIKEMEEKYQQPPSELLQDLSIILDTKAKETFEDPGPFPPELRFKIWDLTDINPLLDGIMKQFKDALLYGFQLHKVMVTLDPDTAHPKLRLSEHHKSVTWSEKGQAVPAKTKRFNTNPFVLGKEQFTTGRHFWEVRVGNEDQWIVGVARKSVKRNGDIIYGTEEGIWAVGKWKGQYRAVNHPHYLPVSPNGKLEKIRVSLNCAGGRVAFFDASTGDHLYTFSGASFSGDTLLPFFQVYGQGYI